MTPGPTLIRKCASCGCLIAQPTLASGNTFGARFWTDGKRVVPMMPDPLWLVACPHCRALVWIDELEQVGEIEGWGEEGRFEDARPFKAPTRARYLRRSQEDEADPMKLRYIRLNAWWAGNDRRRDGRGARALCESEVTNLAALVSCLDEANDDERLMKAEALRELGRFEESLALLARPIDEGLARIAEFIAQLAQKRDPLVREVVFG